jgi:ketosteroid isomerase-like protein
MDAATLAREYYRAIDEADYDALADLLAPGFVHERPDRTLDGRERFVRFMREERPATDTTHELDAVYLSAGAVDAANDADADDATGTDGDATGVAARGRLLRADGSEWFRFVDAFAVEGGRIAGLTTYTH